MPESKEALHIACASIVPDCPFEATAGTEEELMTKVREHVAHVHGVTTVSPELATQVKAAITTR